MHAAWFRGDSTHHRVRQSTWFVNFYVCAKFHECCLGPKQFSHVPYLDIVVGDSPCCRLGAKSEQRLLAVRAFVALCCLRCLCQHDLFAGALERLSDVVGLSGSRRVIVWAIFAAWASVRSHFVQDGEAFGTWHHGQRVKWSTDCESSR